MIYDRTFRISSSHFNSEETYKFVWDLVEKPPPSSLPRVDVICALKDSHGHNFRIVVSLERPLIGNDQWIVDDEQLSNVVMGWNNINLSMHNDFLNTRIRATTENMARLLVTKLIKAF